MRPLESQNEQSAFERLEKGRTVNDVLQENVVSKKSRYSRRYQEFRAKNPFENPPFAGRGTGDPRAKMRAENPLFFGENAVSVSEFVLIRPLKIFYLHILK